MACNPLVSQDHEGWHAWCKSHSPLPWIGPVREFVWQAREDRDAHAGVEPEPVPPPWARGPGR